MKSLHQKIFYTLFALGFLLLPLASMSQDTDEFTAFIHDVFETRFNKMGETRNPQDFIDAFDPGFRGIRTSVGIDGKVDFRAMNEENIKQTLVAYMGRGDLHVTWTIVKVNHVTTKEKTGAISFQLSSSISRDGEVISTVVNMVEVVAKKRHTGYKIVYFSIMQVEESVTHGRCYADIFSQGNKDFVTQIYLPEGPTYNMVVDNFSFGGDNEKRWIRVNNGEFVYYWNPGSGEISTAKTDGEIVGSAKSANVAIKVILKHQNQDKCESVVSRKKGD